MFSFTSFGVSLDKDLASLRKCIYTFQAYGQIYHDLPALVLEENNSCYFQLYFYDTGNELCHNDFPLGLNDHENREVATNLFCTGVIGHSGYNFLN